MRIKGWSHFVRDTRKHRIAAISRDWAKNHGWEARVENKGRHWEKGIQGEAWEEEKRVHEQLDLGFAAISEEQKARNVE